MKKIRLAIAGAICVASMLMMLCLASMLAPNVSAGEPPEGIWGYVRDKISNQPISGASVSGGGTTATTSSSGSYYLSIPYQGRFTVTVSKSGYVTQSKDASINSRNGCPQLDFSMVRSKYDAVQFYNAPYSVQSNNLMKVRCWHWGTSYLYLWVRCPDGTIAVDTSGYAWGPRQVPTVVDGYTDITFNVAAQYTTNMVGMYHFHGTSAEFGFFEDKTYVKLALSDPTPTDTMWLDYPASASPDPSHPGGDIYGYDVYYIHTSAATVKIQFVTAAFTGTGFTGPYLAVGPSSEYTCSVKTSQSPGFYHYEYSTYDCLAYWQSHGNPNVLPQVYRGVQLVKNGVVIQEFWYSINPFARK